MEKSSCCVCQKPKATLHCSLCQSAVCKNCSQFLEEEQFAFLPVIPEELKHSTYCGPCFTTQVAPQIQDYNETMEKAKNITVFFTTDSKQTRNFKRHEKTIRVSDCADRDEVVMRLAFLAVKSQFNAIIDVEVVSQKIRNGAYQTTKFSGSGMPTNVTSSRYK